MAKSLRKTTKSARALHSRVRPEASPSFSAIAGKITLAIIVISTLLVIFTIITHYIFSPERLAKSEISTLAKEYYEDIFYPKITDRSVLETYKASGLPRLTLRQLVLHTPALSPAKHAEEYCDINSTIIRIYPDPPYGKSDYHVEYTYACEF